MILEEKTRKIFTAQRSWVELFASRHDVEWRRRQKIGKKVKSWNDEHACRCCCCCRWWGWWRLVVALGRGRQPPAAAKLDLPTSILASWIQLRMCNAMDCTFQKDFTDSQAHTDEKVSISFKCYAIIKLKCHFSALFFSFLIFFFILLSKTSDTFLRTHTTEVKT